MIPDNGADRAALLECGRLKILLEESSSKLSDQREMNSAIRTENFVLKQRIEELERLNSKQERKVRQWKETVARVKNFSLQLSIVEKDFQETHAALDKDAGHALMLLKELRFAIQKQYSSETNLCKIALPSLCSCIDEVSRALKRIRSYSPSSSSAPSTPSTGHAKPGAVASLIQRAELSAVALDAMYKQNNDLASKLAEKNHEARQTQLYVKALESRLCLLEAEIAPLRSQSSSTTARVLHAPPLESLSAPGDNSRRTRTTTKPLQSEFYFKPTCCGVSTNSYTRAAAKSLISGFIADPYAV